MRKTALAVAAAILFSSGGWLLAQQTQSQGVPPFLLTFERAPIWESVFTV